MLRESLLCQVPLDVPKYAFHDRQWLCWGYCVQSCCSDRVTWAAIALVVIAGFMVPMKQRHEFELKPLSRDDPGLNGIIKTEGIHVPAQQPHCGVALDAVLAITEVQVTFAPRLCQVGWLPPAFMWSCNNVDFTNDLSIRLN